MDDLPAPDNARIQRISEMQPTQGLLSPNWPLFDEEFIYPEIARHRLDPDNTNPVEILTAGEWNELVILRYFSGMRPTQRDTDWDEVIFDPYEAWLLMKQLDHWFTGRRVQPDA